MGWGEIRQRCLEEAVRRGLSQADAEDVAQEAVVRALTRGATYPLTYAVRCVQQACRHVALERSVSGVVVSRSGHTDREVATPAVAEDLASLGPVLEWAYDVARESRVVEAALSLLHRQGRSVEDLEREELPELLEVARELACNAAWAGASMGGSTARSSRHRARDRALARLGRRDTPPIT